MKGFINFLGWVTLTYSWLHVNMAFVAAILEAIENHNGRKTKTKTLNQNNPGPNLEK